MEGIADAAINGAAKRNMKSGERFLLQSHWRDLNISQKETVARRLGAANPRRKSAGARGAQSKA
ncbi:hypothetical protein FRC06_006658 [Ceratobasidium sp. 370]|nr:hypothetical protein FRC06_006658 [Ceratobasidium sp. 370]